MVTLVKTLDALNSPCSADGVVFLTSTMSDDQIADTHNSLQQPSAWHQIEASSEYAFNAVCECLSAKQDIAWSLGLNFVSGMDLHRNRNGYSNNLHHVSNMRLHTLQLDLSSDNAGVWCTILEHLRDNQIIKQTLTKLQLPRYVFTTHLNDNRFFAAFNQFMNGCDKLDKQRQRLSSLTHLCIDMDDDLLPSEQQHAEGLTFIEFVNFSHPIYQSVRAYVLDRLQILQCPFDVFMVIAYGLWCTQFPFLQNRAKQAYKTCNNGSDARIYVVDEMFLTVSLTHPLCIAKLIVYPPIVKKEMLLFVHTLQYENSPNLTSLEFQNWSKSQLALFCKQIQHYTYIQYEYERNRKQLRRRGGHHRHHSTKQSLQLQSQPKKHQKHKRYKSQQNNDIDRIIAEIDGVDFKSEVLKKKAFFHHIQSWKMNVASSSLFAAVQELQQMVYTSKHQRRPRGEMNIKSVPKLYDRDDEKNEAVLCDGRIETAVHSKALKGVMLMGDILRYQFCNLLSFACNNYLFLFSSQTFMRSLMNGICVHPFVRDVELQGIGGEKCYGVTTGELCKVIAQSAESARKHYNLIDDCLRQTLGAKDVRVEIMKCLYGELFCNDGCGLLYMDVSTDKVSGRRHSIHTALKTMKRRRDTETVDTKLADFDKVFEALERNWIGCALGNSELYWQWKKESRKVKSVHMTSYNFTAM